MSRQPTPCLSGASLALLLALLLPVAAQGQSTAAPSLDWREPTQRWLDTALSHALPAGAAPLRLEVVLGELDSRLRLAPCSKVEPFVPPGARLWGKTRLGLRCVEGSSKWSVFLPLTVKAFGPAWVIRGDVASGAVLTQTDAVEAEVDWAEDASPVVAKLAGWEGYTATRALSTGQVLRQSVVKPAQVFQAGAQVRVVARGYGFQVVSDAQALSAGVIGQVARVRMDNGRIMTGLVTDGRTVSLDI
ncbi:MAG: flagellar basal body P-ring formation chaperone FlgA [Betaproteobacteria bacterium]